MGFLRKGLFVATGGLSGAAGIKANSKKERTAKALEKQLRLQKQQMRLEKRQMQQNRQAEALQVKPPVSRSGPSDLWLNEVVVALAEFGLTEKARNTGFKLGGVPLQGDVGLVMSDVVQGDIGLVMSEVEVWVNLFATEDMARQAATSLVAAPKNREALSKGVSKVQAVGRVCYVATGRESAVVACRLEEVSVEVGKIGLPPPAEGDASHGVRLPDDPLDMLRKLAELRDAGVVSEAEFEVKKAKLLGRI